MRFFLRLELEQKDGNKSAAGVIVESCDLGEFDTLAAAREEYESILEAAGLEEDGVLDDTVNDDDDDFDS